MKLTLKAILCVSVLASSGWGFFGHQRINRLAVFTLPPEMIGFYKKHIGYLSEASTYPDRRRYSVPEEGARHYIDFEDYGDSSWIKLPMYWSQAVKELSLDTLQAHGIVPWHVVFEFNQLKDAFMLGDPSRILRLSAELGHYVADAHVPLHTTRNHNGQLTGQRGIHAFWESRLPELFFDDYDFFVGRADYLPHPQQVMWEVVRQSHALVDSVLREEKILSETSADKYNYETKGKQTVRVYSAGYSRRYHERLGGMVERRFRASIKVTGDLWYTAWVDAGQPDLRKLIQYAPSEGELKKREEELKKWKELNFSAREHEGMDKE